MNCINVLLPHQRLLKSVYVIYFCHGYFLPESEVFLTKMCFFIFKLFRTLFFFSYSEKSNCWGLVLSYISGYIWLFTQKCLKCGRDLLM